MMNKEQFLAKCSNIFEPVVFRTILERALLVSEKSQSYGFLAFEDNLDNTRIGNRDIFEYGLQLCIYGYGYEPKMIEKILSNIIKQEKDETAILLKNIKAEAVLHIKAGTNSRLLILILNCYTNIPLDDPLMKKIFED